MEEISIKRIIDVLMKNIKKIGVIALIGFLCGIIYTNFFVKKQYKSTVSVVIPKTYIIEEYAKKINTAEVLEKVAEEYGISVKNLKSNTSVDLTNKKTYTINIIETNTSSEKSAEIANSIANNFIKVLSSNYSIKDARIIKKAEPSSKYYNFSFKIILANCIKLILALEIIYIFIILTIEFFSNKVKTKYFVENKLALNILGTIGIENKIFSDSDERVLKKQVYNITNRVINMFNDKKIIMIQTNDVINGELNDFVKSFSAEKRIAILNFNPKIKCKQLENVYYENIDNSFTSGIDQEIEKLKEDYEYIFIIAPILNGYNFNEKIISICDVLFILLKTNVSKISELEMCIRILQIYKKFENSYGILYY